VIVIVVCCLLGIIWAIYNIYQVEKIKVVGGQQPSDPNIKPLTLRQEEVLLELGAKISEVRHVTLRAQRSFSKQNTPFASSSSQ
jgi:hypothetical protein